MSYLCLSETTYADFARPINQKLLTRRIPICATFELTHRCNLKCVHCYCNQAENNKEILSRELSDREIFKILDDIAQNGCLWLLLTGGEILLREDFLDIYMYAKKKGFIISLFTNATRLTPEIADVLSEYLPYRIEVTLYGSSKSVYEKVTGVPGSYEQCMRGIELILSKDIPLALKTMVSSLNKQEMWEIKKFAEKLNVNFRFDPLLHPRIDGSRLPCDYRLSPQEAASLDLEDPDRLKYWKAFLEKKERFKQTEYLYDCGAGKNSFFIDPYGNISICSMAIEPSYNMKNYSFTEIWGNLFPLQLDRKYGHDAECTGCELVLYCPSCAGWGVLENNDPESKVEYLCQIARFRKEAFVNLPKTGGENAEEKICETGN